MKDITIIVKEALDRAATEAEHCEGGCKCAACRWLIYLLGYDMANVVAPPLFPELPNKGDSP